MRKLFSNQLKPGEPSGDDSHNRDEEENRMSNGTMPVSPLKEPLSATSVRAPSPHDPSKKAGISFHNDTQSHAQESGPTTTTYNMGEWSAVGGTGGVLVDMSDTSSYSSNNSSALSMESTMRASALDTPFAKEVDKLVAKKDWDGLQLAAKSYDPTANTAITRTSETSIEEKKRRKRELEASFRQARTKSEDSEPDTHWA